MIVENDNSIAISPGEFVKELLEEKDMSQKELAHLMGLSEEDVNNLMNCDVQLTESIAMKLEMVFGMSAGYWFNLENAFRTALSEMN